MTDRFTEPTGKSMTQWLSMLDDPHSMPHKDMAEFFVAQGVSAWWAQGLTVAIEQHIGRREVGQTCAGTWSASASKTVPGEWEDTFRAFVAFMTLERLPMEGTEPTTSATEKWRYWRTQLVDGSKVVITCQSRTPGKATFAVNHDGLADNVSRETMKAFWRQTLSDFVDSR